MDAEISGGGLFLDLGSHMLDLLDWLLGPLKDIQVSCTHTGKIHRAQLEGMTCPPSCYSLQGMANRISPSEEGSAGDIDLSARYVPTCT